ncbi:hypothetical protein scyTo_0009742 [Scyliorhinus torazame]|uniref:Ig-like domain-containing protein n=1 Tax=Scyliorhinus torazame TaxID=75743 RepID=A0A401NSW0_SCYTO|nr:hypothetical protein [Scyliorhinus torazame]
MPPARASLSSLRLKCRSADFYPKEYNLTWKKNGSDIVTGFITKQTTTKVGLYNVISTLDEKRAIGYSTVYTCLVHHPSISIPANASYAFVGQDFESKITIALITGYVTGAVAIAMLTVMILKGLRIIISNGTTRKPSGAIQHEDQDEQFTADNKLTYAELDLMSPRQTGKAKQREESTVYIETKHGSTDNKLTYATLTLTDSINTSKTKAKEVQLIYSTVKTSS